MSNSYLSKAFWSGTIERVIRSFAASLLSSFTVGHTLDDWDWQTSLSIAGGAALVTLLIAVVVNGTTNGTGPGITETPLAVDEDARQERLALIKREKENGS